MFKNLLISAYRNFLRNKISGFINILGLAVGMACVLIILTYILHELSFDDFHKNKSRIYRVSVYNDISGSIQTSAISSAPIGPDMVRELPEVENMVRMTTLQAGFFRWGDHLVKARNIMFVDSTFFNIFSFRILEGDPINVLNAPNTVVLTKKYAEMIFDKLDPIGKMMTWNGNVPLRVTGVMEDPPANSHLQFHALISMSTYLKHYQPWIGWDGGFNYYTYVRLSPVATLEGLQQKLPDFLEKHINYKFRKFGGFFDLILQPLEDIYLFSDLDFEGTVKGNIKSIYYLSVIALLILVLAGINYTNLTTARSVRRAKEVGVRKVLGADKRRIFLQFIGETWLICLVALVLALILTEIARPHLNDLLHTNLEFYGVKKIPYYLIMIAMILLLGLLSGGYPALFMSRYLPARVLKGEFFKGKSKPLIRKALVVIQFVISSGLIIATLVILQQYVFVQNKDLGFARNHIYMISLQSEKSRNSLHILKTRLLQNPHVVAVGASSDIPGRGLTSNGYVPEGENYPMMFNLLEVDQDYLDMMDIQITQGRDFHQVSGPGTLDLLVNETMLRELDWANPVGKKIYRDTSFNVLGVVGDFHFSTLYDKIHPLVISYGHDEDFYFLSFKSDGIKRELLMPQIEEIWNEVNPGHTFRCFSFHDILPGFYQKDKNFGELLFYFTLLAIIISGLGVFGLILYTAQQRTKEIGIRKAFGSSTEKIVGFMAAEVIRLVVIANLISWPVTYYLMNLWLKKYAYAVGIQFQVYFYALLITLVITLLTTVFVIIRVARANPMQSLKYE